MVLRVWPTDTFQARDVDIALSGRVITGGQSVSGISQVARTDGGGLWVVNMSGIMLRTPTKVRLWRAWDAWLDGGVTLCVVPICDRRQAPNPVIDGVTIYPSGGIPHSDDTLHSDDTGYAQGSISATSAASASLRATTLEITMGEGSSLYGGEHFSIVHPTKGVRLYRIAAILGRVGQVYTVEIRTPLREAIDADTLIDFDYPRCTMRLASPDAMRLNLSLLKFGTVSVTFVEAFE